MELLEECKVSTMAQVGDLERSFRFISLHAGGRLGHSGGGAAEISVSGYQSVDITKDHCDANEGGFDDGHLRSRSRHVA